MVSSRLCASSIEATPLAWKRERKASAVGLPAGLREAVSTPVMLPGAALVAADATGEVLMMPLPRPACEARAWEGELGHTQVPSCVGEAAKHRRAEASPVGDIAIGAVRTPVLAPVLSTGVPGIKDTALW